MALASALLTSCALPLAAAGESPVVEFLSAHPELLLVRSQAWGELGFDTAAHELHKTGEALRIGAQSYTNGLGHHANGRLVVLLGGDYEQSATEVGLQPCGGGAGTVVFRVSADGRAISSGCGAAGPRLMPTSWMDRGGRCGAFDHPPA